MKRNTLFTLYIIVITLAYVTLLYLAESIASKGLDVAMIFTIPIIFCWILYYRELKQSSNEDNS